MVPKSMQKERAQSCQVRVRTATARSPSCARCRHTRESGPAPGTVRASQLFEKGCAGDSAKKKNFRSPLVHAAATRLEAGRIFHAGLRKLWLRRADLLRASGTAARLVRRRSRGYAVRRWALRTTGVRRSVRIDLLIGNNTFPTWPVQVEPWLDLPRLTSSHTLSNSLSAARSSHLRRVLRSTGCWRGGRGCWASRAACELKMHLKQMVLLLTGLERLPARPLHGQRAALTHSLPRLRSPLLTVGLLPSALPL